MNGETTDIGLVGLATSLVLVFVAVAVSLWQRLGLERSIIWSCTRAAVQLLAVGYALKLVLDPSQPLALAWAWVLVMVVFASVTVRNRAAEVPGILPLALVALVVVSIVSLGVVFGLQIFPMEANAIVPLSGMVIGNSMTSTVVVARRVVAEMRDKRDEVEARLALGHTWQNASKPYMRDALRTALIPQIESTKAVGLVFLPGAMTGLILAGVDPTRAVLIQAAVMFLILGSVATTVTVIGLGLARKLFTPDHRLVHLDRPASG